MKLPMQRCRATFRRFKVGYVFVPVVSDYISSIRPRVGDVPDTPEHQPGLSLSAYVLLLGCVLAWAETLHEMEFEPRALQTARQIASVVNLSRAAVMHTDAINRVALFKTMKDQEQVTISLREPKDTFEPLERTDISQHITDEIKSRLGPGSVVAKSVNGEEGLWVGLPSTAIIIG
ncbi:MAG: hypothetical protein IPP21_08910 [Betaproteobacteria bacterium]|nr:hypothetical protein [Betaproteobacteria bacterium]